jgi:hypothetical protein
MMKNLKVLIGISALALLFSSCSIITGIFKAGMGVGIFIVVIIIVAIVALVLRARK